MEHSLQLTLTKEGIYRPTSAGGKFRLWKMAKEIKTCDRMMIDEGHNVVYDVVVLNIIFVRPGLTY